jgi:hypothetical protein
MPSTADVAPDDDHDFDQDVVIVGGGPAGCSAGVFTARYGLDTVIFDCGRSSLKRCAYLENYLGFPAGIDIERLYGLMHDHAEEAGCSFVAELVETVERTDEGDGFVVTTQDGTQVTARRVVSATRYDGEYLWSLGDEDMLTTYEYDGEEHETFDRQYPDSDGSTPIDGVYVATPSNADRQAIIAAGRGARVGKTVIEDVREARGYPEDMASHADWVRQDAERDEEWHDRDTWREWFDDRLPDDHDLSEERRIELRERDIDRTLETYISDDEIERRAERGQRRLLDHVEDHVILDRAREIEADETNADDEADDERERPVEEVSQ